jgi:hypothetical protein
VTDDVRIRSGYTLTLEPCAEVQLAEGRSIEVAFPGTPNEGTLVAEGTAERPIHVRGRDGARWGVIHVHAPGTARFAHVTFEDGGNNDLNFGATLQAVGDGKDGADLLLFVDHVTITGSRGAGVALTSGAAFLPASRDLTIEGSGDETMPYPLAITEHAIDSLPTGVYTGNEVDEILLDPEGGEASGSGLLADATLRNLGVPYHVGNSPTDALQIGGRVDKQLVTLTVEAGVVLRFEPETKLDVQRATNDDPSTAALRVLGTATDPVIFTSAAPTPAAGDWQGIWFGGVPSAENTIDYLRIEYAGGDCSCTRVTCSEGVEEHSGAIIFTEQPPSAFITNTVIAMSAGHGITQGFDGSLVNFRPTNTFEGLGGCIQTHPRGPDTQCPDPRPICDGL